MSIHNTEAESRFTTRKTVRLLVPRIYSSRPPRSTGRPSRGSSLGPCSYGLSWTRTFGLQFATAKDQDWIFATGNGDPTFGFLKFGTNPEGPFARFFNNLGAQVASRAHTRLTPDVGSWIELVVHGWAAGNRRQPHARCVHGRIGSIGGVVLLGAYVAGRSSMGEHDRPDTGQGTFNNPFMDEHIIFAIALIMLMLFTSERTWGLGKWWESTSLVQRFPWLA